MAVVVSTLTQDERDLAAADKPILSSVLDPDDRIGSKWVTATTTGTTISPNGDDTNRPSSRLVDGLPGLKSAPNASTTTFTIVLEFVAPGGVEFDWIGILNHNLDSLACSDISLQVADDAAFTVNLRTIMSRDPSATLSADRRFTELELIDTGGDAQRFSGVEFARFQLTFPGASLPEIGQIVIGRRRQLRYEPNRPWDPTDLHTNLDRFETRSGVRIDTIRYRGRRRLAANINPDAAVDLQNIKDWFDNTLQGSLPFCWIDKPGTLPDDFWLMKLDEPSLEFPYVLWSTRETTIMGSEQGPTFFSKEGQGP